MRGVCFLTQVLNLASALDFSGKTILITGGGVGIGRAIADGFAAAGGDLIIVEKDADLAAALMQAHPKATVIAADICDRATPARIASHLEKASQHLDVLINNVGHFVHARPFEALSSDEAEEVLDVNLGQLLRTTSAMIPFLRQAESGASIINITSIEAFRAIPNCSVYAAAKAGIAGFTKSLAVELAPAGIRVNDIAPETTDTPQLALDYMIPAANRTHEERWIPLGRFGKPSDCAGAALYLASPLAAWVTGTTLHVDGGALAAAGWYRTPQGEWTNTPIISGNGMVVPS